MATLRTAFRRAFVQRQVHKADMLGGGESSSEWFLGSEVHAQKKGEEVEMRCLGSPGLQDGIVSTGLTSLTTATTKKPHRTILMFLQEPPPAQQSKRSGFCSRCSSMALQVSTRLAAKSPALPKSPASGFQSCLSHQHPSSTHCTSATPPTLPACPHRATKERMLHGDRRCKAQSPRTTFLLHTKVSSISPGPFRASGLP